HRSRHLPRSDRRGRLGDRRGRRGPAARPDTAGRRARVARRPVRRLVGARDRGPLVVMPLVVMPDGSLGLLDLARIGVATAAIWLVPGLAWILAVWPAGSDLTLLDRVAWVVTLSYFL